MSGVVLPLPSLIVGFVNVVARLIYTVMYVKYGSNYRALGSIAGGMPIYILGLVAFIWILAQN